MNFSKGVQTLESMSQAVWYNRWTLNKFKKYLKGEILEVGCGIGNFTGSLKQFGSLYAIDIDKNHIYEVKKVIDGKVGFGDIESGKYFFKNKQSLRSKDLKKFDTVVCLNVLEHIRKDGSALTNLYKLLKDDGHLILLVPAHPFLYGKIDESIGHFRRYKKKDLIKKLGDIGFKILKCRRLNFLGAAGWFMAGRILGEDRVGEDRIKIFNLIAPAVLPIEDILEPPIGTSILIIAQKEGQ